MINNRNVANTTFALVHVGPSATQPITGRDYYDVLGITRSASTAEIKKAYRTGCRLNHPDRRQSDPVAKANFMQLTEAYTVLSDPLDRQAYDNFTSGKIDTASATGLAVDTLYKSFLPEAKLIKEYEKLQQTLLAFVACFNHKGMVIIVAYKLANPSTILKNNPQAEDIVAAELHSSGYTAIPSEHVLDNIFGSVQKRLNQLADKINAARAAQMSSDRTATTRNDRTPVDPELIPTDVEGIKLHQTLDHVLHHCARDKQVQFAEQFFKINVFAKQADQTAEVERAYDSLCANLNPNFANKRGDKILRRSLIKLFGELRDLTLILIASNCFKPRIANSDSFLNDSKQIINLICFSPYLQKIDKPNRF